MTYNITEVELETIKELVYRVNRNARNWDEFAKSDALKKELMESVADIERFLP